MAYGLQRLVHVLHHHAAEQGDSSLGKDVGRIGGAEPFARVTGPCGDTMEISLRVRADKVVVAFWTDGCGSSVVCCSVTTELVKGNSVAEASRVDSRLILESLDGSPESDVHCAVLASDTLKAATRNHQTKGKSTRKSALGIMVV